MGLLMVVILIIIGAVFYLKYAVLSDKDESFQSTEREIQAVNSVKALMNLETCNVTIKKAIDMCSNQEDLCGELSCDYLDDFIKNVYSKVIEDDYLFLVFEGNSEILRVEQNKCEYGVSSGDQYIQEGSNYYIVRLKICYR
ncbi:hypothetical protein J4436_00585 [Candidatus Woesearchaeota archaeon]|nr:hypothetical protein [Candidatus Woesearchaeota archaeon]